MRKVIIYSLISTALFANSVSFDEALKLALDSNRDLKSKKLDIDIAKLRVKERESLDFGRVKLSEEFSYTDNSLYVFGNKLSQRSASFKDFGFSSFNLDNPDILSVEPNDLNNPESLKNFNTKVEYELPLFTGFKISNAKDIAKLQVRASEFKYLRDEKLLEFEIFKAYNGAVASRYFIEALNKTKEATQSFVKLASLLFEEGIVTKIDVLEAKERDFEVNAKIIDAKNRYKLAIAYLKFLISDESISNVEDFESISCKDKPLELFQRVAIENRMDLKHLKSNKKIVDKEIDYQKSSLYPEIGLTTEYGFNSEKLNFDESYYMVGVGLKYTLFDGGERDSKIEQSRVKSQKMELLFNHMKSAIELDVENSYFELKSKMAVKFEKLKSKELAEEVLQKAKEMYKNGLISMNELLLKEASAERSRANVIEAKYNQAVAEAKLKLSIGESLKNN